MACVAMRSDSQIKVQLRRHAQAVCSFFFFSFFFSSCGWIQLEEKEFAKSPIGGRCFQKPSLRRRYTPDFQGSWDHRAPVPFLSASTSALVNHNSLTHDPPTNRTLKEVSEQGTFADPPFAGPFHATSSGHGMFGGNEYSVTLVSVFVVIVIDALSIFNLFTHKILPLNRVCVNDVVSQRGFLCMKRTRGL